MNNIQEIKNIIVQINYIFTNKQRRSAKITLFLILIGAILELAGIAVIIPFLNAMMYPQELKKNAYIALALKIFNIKTDMGMLLFLGIAIILFYLAKNLILLLIAYKQNKFSALFQQELSERLLICYMKKPYSFFREVNSAEIIRATTGDANSVYMVMLNLLDIITQLMLTFMIAIYLFFTDYIMAIAVLSIAAVTFVLIISVFKKQLKQSGIELRNANINTTKATYEAIDGIKEIIIMDRTSNFINRYHNAIMERLKATITYSFISACPDRIIEAACVGGLIGIVCIKLLLGQNVNEFVPALAAFALAAFKIMPSISKLSNKVNALIVYRPSLNAVYSHLEGTEQEQGILAKIQDIEQKREISFSKSLELKNIIWKYNDGEENVLENVSLSIKCGESVALIGASGSGKSTLVDIILGLFSPQQGSVEMDDIDIRRIPHQWSRIVGYVPQTVYLLDDTLRNNIAFGLSESEIDDEKIWKAIEKAQLKEFVDSLPHKLDTIVGEHGVKFSGGQRQRVAIARALYHDPDILVLDEATSALDDGTEESLMGAIDALKGHKTLIIVAHRLSTIRNCDKVYEVKQKNVELKVDKDSVNTSMLD